METHLLASCCWCGSPFVRGLVTVGGLVPWVCPTEACWRRQVAHAMFTHLKGKDRRCRFVPLPRQVEAAELLQRVDGPTYVLMGGAAGGSKSKGLRELAHAACMTTPGYRVLLLRRTYKELEQTHLRDLEIEAPEMGAVAVPSAKVCRYPNGSILQCGHCETAADAGNYLSAEYDLIIFDELVTFEETPFLLISSRARSSKPGVAPKILCGTNPGGPQSHWVRARFIDKSVDRTEYPDYDPAEWAFIPSKLEDNPYLDQQYERKLLALPPEMRKAYRDGDWDIFPGQYFPEWRKGVHVTREHRVIAPDVPRVLSFDWGYVNYGVCLWWALVDGKAYLEEEYVFKLTLASEVGKEIARRCKDRGLSAIKYLVYDTAMEIPNNDSGESTIETVRRGMRAGGLSVGTRPADKDRINGWQRVRHWLHAAPDGAPWLQVSPLCTYTARTLPSLVSDASRPEDVDTDGEDHAADALRYFVMSRPTPGTVTKSTTAQEWTMGWLKARTQTPTGILAGREVRVG